MRNTIILGIILAIPTMVFSSNDSTAESRHSKVKLDVWAWFVQGQIVNSGNAEDWSNTEANTYKFDHTWVSQMYLGLRASRELTPKTTIVVHPAFWLHANSVFDAPNQNNVTGWKLGATPYLIEATISSEFMEADFLSLGFKVGYFNYKFNPEVRNLGEYPIRSVTNPLFLWSGFEFADKHKELGLLSSMDLADGMFGWDLLFTSETKVYPLYDFSLANVIRFKPIELIDFGAAIMLDRIIPVDEKKTIPGKQPLRLAPGERDFYIHLDSIGFRREEEVVYTWSEFLEDSVADTNIVRRTLYDTTYYSFAGTKLGVRLTIDPKWFFNSDAFVESDLKIYTEAAIIGLEHYESLYDNIWERTPIMAGINVPTHPLVAAGVLGGIQLTGLLDDMGILNFMDGRIEIPSSPAAAVGLPVVGVGTYVLEQLLKKKLRLDLLNIEVEYLGRQYANSLKNVWLQASPIPVDGEVYEPGVDMVQYYYYSKADNWKWSLYTCKSITDYLRFSFQVANDHTQRAGFGARAVYNDVTIQPNDWYFMGLMEIMF